MTALRKPSYVERSRGSLSQLLMSLRSSTVETMVGILCLRQENLKQISHSMESNDFFIVDMKTFIMEGVLSTSAEGQRRCCRLSLLVGLKEGPVVGPWSETTSSLRIWLAVVVPSLSIFRSSIWRLWRTCCNASMVEGWRSNDEIIEVLQTGSIPAYAAISL